MYMLMCVPQPEIQLVPCEVFFVVVATCSVSCSACPFLSIQYSILKPWYLFAFGRFYSAFAIAWTWKSFCIWPLTSWTSSGLLLQHFLCLSIAAILMLIAHKCQLKKKFRSLANENAKNINCICINPNCYCHLAARKRAGQMLSKHIKEKEQSGCKNKKLHNLQAASDQHLVAAATTKKMAKMQGRQKKTGQRHRMPRSFYLALPRTNFKSISSCVVCFWSLWKENMRQQLRQRHGSKEPKKNQFLLAKKCKTAK